MRNITNRYALTRHVAALGVVWMVLLAMLTGGFVALGAAQEDIDDGYSTHTETVETDGPMTIAVDLEAATNTDLDTDPLRVTTDVDGETETVDLESEQTETIEVDVDSYGEFDVEVLLEAEGNESDLESSTVSTTEDRASGASIGTSGNHTVTNDTTDAFADVSVTDDPSENVSVTLEVADNSSGDLLRYQTETIEPGESGSLEINVSDLDVDTQVDLEVVGESGVDSDYIEVDDAGLLGDSGGIGLPGVDGSVDVPMWAIYGIIAVGAAVVVDRR